MERRLLRLSSPIILVVLLCAAAAAASELERVSISSAGTEGHQSSDSCCSNSAVSSDGRFVAFSSVAYDLVPGDTNRVMDVFVRDRVLGTTTRVSVSSLAEEGNDYSIVTGISADGRHVAYRSRASNLVPGDTNGKDDVFVHDRATGTTVRMTGLHGEQFPEGAYGAMSANGRFVTFATFPFSFVLVRDRDTDADGLFDEAGAASTVMLDLGSAPVVSPPDRYPPSAISDDGRFVALYMQGTWGQRALLHDRDPDQDGTFDEPGTLATIDFGHSSSPQTLTPDGRFLAFNSRAPFVPEDTNGTTDVYVYDRLAGTSRRVSVSSAGGQVQSFGGAYFGIISATGRFVAFATEGALVPHDTNFTRDIYVHDRDADQDGIFDEPGAISTTRVSENAAGESPQSFNGGISISADGTHVVFQTFVAMVPGDTNGVSDFFLRRFNFAPVLGAIGGPETPITIGTDIALQASFADVNSDDTHTAQWNWGDGSTSGSVFTESDGSRYLSGIHAYTLPGVYTVTLTLTDAAGAVATSRYEYIVIYDPSGGFVSGNALIVSPAGALAADPALTGPARVSFVSRYQRGANAPDGNMQFDFKVADFNFRSSGYAWLVVGGGRAQLKGTGAVNGAAGFDVLLSVVDGDLVGGTDRVRVKIWDAASGTIVYDNQRGAADDATATTVITGGSIVIHK